jgi:hypothetical protein
MKPFLRYAVILAAIYFAAWTVSYAGIFVSRGDGLDFSHYFEYLALAWTFHGGELPAFILLFSVIAFLPLAVLAVYLLRKYERRAKDVA